MKKKDRRKGRKEKKGSGKSNEEEEEEEEWKVDLSSSSLEKKPASGVYSPEVLLYQLKIALDEFIGIGGLWKL